MRKGEYEGIRFLGEFVSTAVPLGRNAGNPLRTAEDFRHLSSRRLRELVGDLNAPFDAVELTSVREVAVERGDQELIALLDAREQGAK